MITIRHAQFITLLASSVLLAACSEKEVILPGERIAITAINDVDLSPDADASGENAGLAAINSNTRFVAPGQSPDHSGGHFSLELPLDRIFSTRVGIAADKTAEVAQPVADENAVYTVTHGGIVTATHASDGTRLWQFDIDPSTDKTQTSTSGGIALADGDIMARRSAMV